MILIFVIWPLANLAYDLRTTSEDEKVEQFRDSVAQVCNGQGLDGAKQYAKGSSHNMHAFSKDKEESDDSWKWLWSYAQKSIDESEMQNLSHIDLIVCEEYIYNIKKDACGPYKELGEVTSNNKYYSLRIQDVYVTIREVKTGQIISDNLLFSGTGECPEYTLVEKYEDVDEVVLDNISSSSYRDEHREDIITRVHLLDASQ